MVLDFASKGYNIKTALMPLYGQLALAGTSRGINLNVQVIRMINNSITAQTFVTNPNMIDKAAGAYMCLIDQFNNATKEEQRNWQQFGTNAIRYEYILAIKDVKVVQNGQFNTEIKLEVQKKRSNLCKL